ncbi:MAG: flagellar biosynthesis protein FlhB [Sphingomonadaceae bacterium]
MAEPPADEKTEAPTSRRRERAREEGDRLQSRDLATALSALAGAGWLWLMGPDLWAGVKAAAAAGFRIEPGDLLDMRPSERLLRLLGPLALPLIALGLASMAAAAAGQALTGSLGFTPGLLAPKPGRLNPLKGLGRMFGRRGLVELLKALMKAIVLLGLSAWLLWQWRGELAGLSAQALPAATARAGELGLWLFAGLVMGLALIAAADVPIQILDWLKRLRMTRTEVKDELKQQEGRPEVKAERRRLARQLARRTTGAALAEASVVLTNPTHYAVALRYRPEVDSVPVVLARGRGLMAEVIRDLAAEAKVPVLSYPSVARALYFTGRVGEAIRPDLYGAVATILAFVLRARDGLQAGEPPPAEAPPTALFDEDGRQVPPPR